MSRGEIPLQHDMFTGETIDARSASQKRKDKEREQPRQAEMFSAREIAQFGVNAHPQLPLSPNTRLELSMVDNRSEEEIEKDRMRAAEALTYSLFSDGENRRAGMSPILAAFLKILGDLQLTLKLMAETEVLETPAAPAQALKRDSHCTTVLIDGVKVLQPY